MDKEKRRCGGRTDNGDDDWGVGGRRLMVEDEAGRGRLEAACSIDRERDRERESLSKMEAASDLD